MLSSEFIAGRGASRQAFLCPAWEREKILAMIRLMRYKAPDGDTSKLLEWPLMRQDMVESTSERFRFDLSLLINNPCSGQSSALTFLSFLSRKRLINSIRLFPN
jgi:hypothetical protein